mmetsp:Transcript_25760/g.64690  ORF Transcript_25760/g.64690 Transcript_25760/m.64690 type:complete len:121 (+) Transcript_25760:78-440(+)
MGESKRTLYVGGLEESVDDKLLHSAFIPFGELVAVQIPYEITTRKHKGFGFVEFEKDEDAADAIDNMEGAELMGRVLKVNVAKPASMSKYKAVWDTEEFHRNKQDAAEAEEVKEGEQSEA